MHIPMKAMRDFRGRPGEGRRGGRLVDAGIEFKVTTQSRARYLEISQLAIPVRAVPAVPPEMSSAIPPPENRAAHTGPLLSAGGETGPVPPQSSSPAVPQRVTPPSTRRGGRRGS